MSLITMEVILCLCCNPLDPIIVPKYQNRSLPHNKKTSITRHMCCAARPRHLEHCSLFDFSQNWEVVTTRPSNQKIQATWSALDSLHRDGCSNAARLAAASAPNHVPGSSANPSTHPATIIVAGPDFAPSANVNELPTMTTRLAETCSNVYNNQSPVVTCATPAVLCTARPQGQASQTSSHPRHQANMSNLDDPHRYLHRLTTSSTIYS